MGEPPYESLLSSYLENGGWEKDYLEGMIILTLVAKKVTLYN